MTDTILPSWSEGPTRQAILEFVRSATKEGPTFVKPADRIATFDNDGTLWCERPMYVQFHFLLLRWAAMVQADPSKREVQPYKAVVEKDEQYLREIANHVPDLLRSLDDAFTGTTPDEFEEVVQGFFAEVHHPHFNVPYSHIAYRPMRELLDLLTGHDFRVFITSAGGRDFMRVISEEIYGISRERVIGTAPEYEYRDGRLLRVARMLGTINDGPGKPSHIFAQVGRLPVFAAGNSDGDIEMLECARFRLLVHHDDEAREYAYDRGTEEALDIARMQGWTVVSMKSDWSTVFE